MSINITLTEADRELILAQLQNVLIALRSNERLCGRGRFAAPSSTRLPYHPANHEHTLLRRAQQLQMHLINCSTHANIRPAMHPPRTDASLRPYEDDNGGGACNLSPVLSLSSSPLYFPQHGFAMNDVLSLSSVLSAKAGQEESELGEAALLSPESPCSAATVTTTATTPSLSEEDILMVFYHVCRSVDTNEIITSVALYALDKMLSFPCSFLTRRGVELTLMAAIGAQCEMTDCATYEVLLTRTMHIFVHAMHHPAAQSLPECVHANLLARILAIALHEESSPLLRRVAEHAMQKIITQLLQRVHAMPCLASTAEQRKNDSSSCGQSRVNVVCQMHGAVTGARVLRFVSALIRVDLGSATDMASLQHRCDSENDNDDDDEYDSDTHADTAAHTNHRFDDNNNCHMHGDVRADLYDEDSYSTSNKALPEQRTSLDANTQTHLTASFFNLPRIVGEPTAVLMVGLWLAQSALLTMMQSCHSHRRRPVPAALRRAITNDMCRSLLHAGVGTATNTVALSQILRTVHIAVRCVGDRMTAQLFAIVRALHLRPLAAITTEIALLEGQGANLPSTLPRNGHPLTDGNEALASVSSAYRAGGGSSSASSGHAAGSSSHTGSLTHDNLHNAVFHDSNSNATANSHVGSDTGSPASAFRALGTGGSDSYRRPRGRAGSAVALYERREVLMESLAEFCACPSFVLHCVAHYDLSWSYPSLLPSLLSLLVGIALGDNHAAMTALDVTIDAVVSFPLQYLTRQAQTHSEGRATASVATSIGDGHRVGGATPWASDAGANNADNINVTAPRPIRGHEMDDKSNAHEKKSETTGSASAEMSTTSSQTSSPATQTAPLLPASHSPRQQYDDTVTEQAPAFSTAQIDRAREAWRTAMPLTRIQLLALDCLFGLLNAAAHAAGTVSVDHVVSVTRRGSAHAHEGAHVRAQYGRNATLGVHESSTDMEKELLDDPSRQQRYGRSSTASDHSSSSRRRGSISGSMSEERDVCRVVTQVQTHMARALAHKGLLGRFAALFNESPLRKGVPFLCAHAVRVASEAVVPQGMRENDTCWVLAEPAGGREIGACLYRLSAWLDKRVLGEYIGELGKEATAAPVLPQSDRKYNGAESHEMNGSDNNNDNTASPNSNSNSHSTLGTVVNNINKLGEVGKSEDSMRSRCAGMEVVGSVEFCKEQLHGFVESFFFRGKTLLAAVRELVYKLSLPGESQKIDRVMEAMAQHWYAENRSSTDKTINPFYSEDGAFVLSFAIIMLNTDLHSGKLKQSMTCEEFINMNRGIDDGRDIADDYLTAVYHDVRRDEVVMADMIDRGFANHVTWSIEMSRPRTFATRHAHARHEAHRGAPYDKKNNMKEDARIPGRDRHRCDQRGSDAGAVQPLPITASHTSYSRHSNQSPNKRDDEANMRTHVQDDAAVREPVHESYPNITPSTTHPPTAPIRMSATTTTHSSSFSLLALPPTLQHALAPFLFAIIWPCLHAVMATILRDTATQALSRVTLRGATLAQALSHGCAEMPAELHACVTSLRSLTHLVHVGSAVRPASPNAIHAALATLHGHAVLDVQRPDDALAALHHSLPTLLCVHALMTNVVLPQLAPRLLLPPRLCAQRLACAGCGSTNRVQHGDESNYTGSGKENDATQPIEDDTANSRRNRADGNKDGYDTTASCVDEDDSDADEGSEAGVLRVVAPQAGRILCNLYLLGALALAPPATPSSVPDTAAGVSASEEDASRCPTWSVVSCEDTSSEEDEDANGVHGTPLHARHGVCQTNTQAEMTHKGSAYSDATRSATTADDKRANTSSPGGHAISDEWPITFFLPPALRHDPGLTRHIDRHYPRGVVGVVRQGVVCHAVHAGNASSPLSVFLSRLLSPRKGLSSLSLACNSPAGAENCAADTAGLTGNEEGARDEQPSLSSALVKDKEKRSSNRDGALANTETDMNDDDNNNNNDGHNNNSIRNTVEGTNDPQSVVHIDANVRKTGPHGGASQTSPKSGGGWFSSLLYSASNEASRGRAPATVTDAESASFGPNSIGPSVDAKSHQDEGQHSVHGEQLSTNSHRNDSGDPKPTSDPHAAMPKNNLIGVSNVNATVGNARASSKSRVMPLTAPTAAPTVKTGGTSVQRCAELRVRDAVPDIRTVMLLLRCGLSRRAHLALVHAVAQEARMPALSATAGLLASLAVQLLSAVVTLPVCPRQACHSPHRASSDSHACRRGGRRNRVACDRDNVQHGEETLPKSDTAHNRDMSHGSTCISDGSNSSDHHNRNKNDNSSNTSTNRNSKGTWVADTDGDGMDTDVLRHDDALLRYALPCVAHNLKSAFSVLALPIQRDGTNGTATGPTMSVQGTRGKEKPAPTLFSRMQNFLGGASATTTTTAAASTSATMGSSSNSTADANVCAPLTISHNAHRRWREIAVRMLDACLAMAHTNAYGSDSTSVSVHRWRRITEMLMHELPVEDSADVHALIADRVSLFVLDWAAGISATSATSASASAFDNTSSIPTSVRPAKNCAPGAADVAAPSDAGMDELVEAVCAAAPLWRGAGAPTARVARERMGMVLYTASRSAGYNVLRWTSTVVTTLYQGAVSEAHSPHRNSSDMYSGKSRDYSRANVDHASVTAAAHNSSNHHGDLAKQGDDTDCTRRTEYESSPNSNYHRHHRYRCDTATRLPWACSGYEDNYGITSGGHVDSSVFVTLHYCHRNLVRVMKGGPSLQATAASSSSVSLPDTAAATAARESWTLLLRCLAGLVLLPHRTPREGAETLLLLQRCLLDPANPTMLPAHMIHVYHVVLFPLVQQLGHCTHARRVSASPMDRTVVAALPPTPSAPAREPLDALAAAVGRCVPVEVRSAAVNFLPKPLLQYADTLASQSAESLWQLWMSVFAVLAEVYYSYVESRVSVNSARYATPNSQTGLVEPTRSREQGPHVHEHQEKERHGLCDSEGGRSPSRGSCHTLATLHPRDERRAGHASMESAAQQQAHEEAGRIQEAVEETVKNMVYVMATTVARPGSVSKNDDGGADEPVLLQSVPQFWSETRKLIGVFEFAQPLLDYVNTIDPPEGGEVTRTAAEKTEEST